MRYLLLQYMKKAASFIVIICSAILAVIAMSWFEPQNRVNTSPPLTKAALGRQLFFDSILSKDYSVSCASCHKPSFAFADTAAFSTGIFGKKTVRNTPSVLNMANRDALFWDGRSATLAAQALQPIQHPNEMGLPITEAVERLRKHAKYRQWFYQVFKQAPNSNNLALAIQAFEETLETSGSKADKAIDDSTALNESEERGRQLFIGDKAKCFDCHFGVDYTGDEFRNIGLYNGKDLNDVGRYSITKKKSDIGKFKTPGLRNIALTAPYMHNGMFKTLEAVVAYYNNPTSFVAGSVNTDPLLQKPLNLTAQEQADLVAFLKALTDAELPK